MNVKPTSGSSPKLRLAPEAYAPDAPGFGRASTAWVLARTPRLTRRKGWAIVALACIAIAASSLAVQNAPYFDAWGWIVWGREILHLHLNTTQGPSWKPGPVVFTTIFALFGGLAPSLWLITARLGALMAIVGAYRVGARLGGRLAGVVAGVLLLVLNGFLRGALRGESEPLMVGLLLFSVDRALARSHRSALILLTLASLLRPEVWPILIVYSVYLWRQPGFGKAWILGSFAVVGLLWFGGDWWGSGNPLLASTRAKQFVEFNGTQHFSRPGWETLKLAARLLHLPSILLAVTAVVFAIVRRNRDLLLVAASAVALLVTVSAMAQDGYPVLGRLLFGGVALTFVLAGIGVGLLVGLARRRTLIAGVAVGAALVGALTPYAVSDARQWSSVVLQARQWSAVLDTLPRAIAAAGGRSRVLACRGSVATSVLMTPALAWDLGTPMTRVSDWHSDPNGIIFIPQKDPLVVVTAVKPLRIRTLAEVAGWRVLEVLTRLPAPPGCAEFAPA